MISNDIKTKRKRNASGRWFNCIFGFLFIVLSFPLYTADCLGKSILGTCFDAYPITIIIAALYDIFGVMLLIHGLLPNRYFKKPVDEQICTQCLRVYYASKAPDWKCPKCGGETENITGFYERHPELKDKEEELPKELETPYKKWR